MSTLMIGDKAPAFEAVNQDGNPISLKDYSGKKLVLYFYPKDDTPGCTAEACNLRDNYALLLKKGYKIVGVSSDDERSHKKFIEKYVLPFPLIADKDKKILMTYGAWGKKNLYGKEYDGILRTTYVISEKGIIEKIFTKVDTKNHTEQILRDRS
jgi:thioredoxin-dependent peroxiredoxin